MAFKLPGLEIVWNRDCFEDMEVIEFSRSMQMVYVFTENDDLEVVKENIRIELEYRIEKFIELRETWKINKV